MMFKKIMDFQKVLYFSNNFDPTQSTKHMGKLILAFILINISYGSIMGIDNSNITSLFFISIVYMYSRINKRIKLWELVPVSNKFAISSMFFNFYHFIFMMMAIGIGIGTVSFINIIWGGNSQTFLNAWNGAITDGSYFFGWINIIGIFIFCIMANASITIFFIRNIKYRFVSLGILFGMPLILAYIFKVIYNEKIFEALASIDNINFKSIILIITSIVFIISLFGGVKIALKLQSKIQVNA